LLAQLRKFATRLEDLLRRHGSLLAIFLFLFAFLFAYFSPRIIQNIPSGHVGVMWKRFGGGTDTANPALSEGLHLIWPWDKIFVYDARLTQASDNFDILSSDGLKMTVNVAYRYELNRKEIPTLHKYIGPAYKNVMIDSDIGARARDVLSQNSPDEIFSKRRHILEAEILQRAQENLNSKFNPEWRDDPVRFVKLWDVLIRSVELPEAVNAAITRKNEQLQMSHEYDFRLIREIKESERKRIEATGIREFQDIVSGGMTDSYLRWRGIEATTDLAKSPNSKIVVIGGGKDGLPLILGNPDVAGKPGTEDAGGDKAAPHPALPAPGPRKDSAP
jgi:regulator of protease activity HflC (stomatin/prohibitin superfamily)